MVTLVKKRRDEVDHRDNLIFLFVFSSIATIVSSPSLLFFFSLVVLTRYFLDAIERWFVLLHNSGLDESLWPTMSMRVANCIDNEYPPFIEAGVQLFVACHCCCYCWRRMTTRATTWVELQSFILQNNVEWLITSVLKLYINNTY